MKEKSLSHVIHIMSTVPSIVHSGNPHNSFQSSVAKFYLAELFDERLDPCMDFGLLHTQMLIWWHKSVEKLHSKWAKRLWDTPDKCSLW